MKIEKQIKIVAKLDVYSNIHENEDGELVGYILNNRSFIPTKPRLIPDYLNDHNAIQRVIDGLANKKCTGYLYQLRYIVIRDSGMNYDEEVGDGEWIDFPYQLVKFLVKATCEQKLVAILKVHDLWEDE